MDHSYVWQDMLSLLSPTHSTYKRDPYWGMFYNEKFLIIQSSTKRFLLIKLYYNSLRLCNHLLYHRYNTVHNQIQLLLSLLSFLRRVANNIQPRHSRVQAVIIKMMCLMDGLMAIPILKYSTKHWILIIKLTKINITAALIQQYVAYVSYNSLVYMHVV